jgi:dihydrodipicolinate synthase/N-acetylneuraminate lyase
MAEPAFPPPVRPGRVIRGHAAVLLPHRDDRSIDWPAFEAHLARTVAAGLTPAVNMDTGYVQLLDETTRTKVLDVCRSTAGADFVAGAFVADRAGDALDVRAYVRAAGDVAARGGIPVVFPSHALSALPEDGWVGTLAAIGSEVGRFLAFELGAMFVPYGRIYSIDAYTALLDVDVCVGAKHSSLSRRAEWDRLAARDAKRPDFAVLTGNDLAIDMVTYGSDYLLGLATFAPDHFARRDQHWANRDDRFAELNDLLQYLGQFCFRPPVPAYRHDAAMFLVLRGWADSDAVPDGVPTRPASERAVLADLVERLDALA